MIPQKGPSTVHFDLCNACNTRCCTCWHHSPLRPALSPEWKRQCLPAERFFKLLDELNHLGGLQQIILSGMGEPTLHKDLPQMLERALQLARVTVITNGIADPPWANIAQNCDLSRLELLLSVCGYDNDSWVQFHNATPPDGFERALHTARTARACGIRVKMVQVITKHNFAGLQRMIQLAADLNLNAVSFKLASLDACTAELALSEEDRKRCLQILVPRAKGLARAKGLETDLDGFAEQLESAADSGRTAPIEKVGCHLGLRYARIDVEGAVYFCCNTALKMGHLAESPFSEIWMGPTWSQTRDQLAAGHFFEGCKCCGKIKQNLKLAQKLAQTKAHV